MAGSWADIGVRTQFADRQHVRVRPVSRLRILSPTCGVVELVLYADGEVVAAHPNVPDIVRYAPHLRKVGEFGMALKRGRSRRKAQYNVAAATLNRQFDLPNFAGLIRMVRNAVNLEEIDTPGCVLTKERVVPRLAGGGVLDSPACGVPRTRVILVGGILSFESRILDRQIAQNTLSRNTANNVNPEFEALCMNRPREFPETHVPAILQS